MLCVQHNDTVERCLNHGAQLLSIQPYEVVIRRPHHATTGGGLLLELDEQTHGDEWWCDAREHINHVMLWLEGVDEHPRCLVAVQNWLNIMLMSSRRCPFSTTSAARRTLWGQCPNRTMLGCSSRSCRRPWSRTSIPWWPPPSPWCVAGPADLASSLVIAGLLVWIMSMAWWLPIWLLAGDSGLPIWFVSMAWNTIKTSMRGLSMDAYAHRRPLEVHVRADDGHRLVAAHGPGYLPR